MMEFFKRFFGRGEQLNQVAPENTLSDAALKVIIDAEGFDQPYSHPGGDSGITLGVGDDLGYQSVAQFTLNWKNRLSASDFSLLASAIGAKGSRAAAMAHLFRGIKIKFEDGLAVFKEHDVPMYIKLTNQTFPGASKLCANARGALVSLVFNRGASLVGPRRNEMAKIKSILDKAPNPADAATYKAVAEQFRAMKTLWKGQGLDGLITRRENEAKLVESCL